MSKIIYLLRYFLRLPESLAMRITGLSRVPAQFRMAVQLAQIDTRARLSVKMAVVGEIVLIAFALGFVGTPGMTLFYGFTLFVSILYGILIWLGRTWRRHSRKKEIFTAFQRSYCTLQFLLGASWSGVIGSALPHADASQIAQIYAILIGLLSTAVFSGPALYSLLLWGPLVLGSTIALLAPGAGTDPATFIGILAYDILSFLSIVELNRKLMEREIGALRIAHLKEETELLLRDFQQGSSDWLFELDHDLKIVHPSDRFCQAAHRAARMMRIDLKTLLREGDHSLAAANDAGIGDLMAHLAAQAPFRDIIVSIPLGGEHRWWDLSGKPLFDAQGNFVGYRGVGRDVTALHRSRERITYLARHDSLTSLLNRDMFSKALEHAISRGDASGTAILCIDLDHFKSVNDNLGHRVGDCLLQVAAERLSACVRGKDMVFRLGGDEFAMILPGIQQIEIAVIAQRIVDNIAKPFRINDLTLTISASVGIAILPTDDDTPEGVHHCADLALYQAKADGRGRFRFFDAQYEDSISRRISIQTDLKEAASSRDQLFVEFQPIVDLKTGAPVSMEALVRWTHPVQGIISPSEFIPAAEDSGMIRMIGKRVINITCDTAGHLADNLSVAINLSARQLRDESLLDTILEALARNRMQGQRVEFEITETTLLEASGYNLGVLERIRELGCRIILDDFGTGYSSFRSLDAFGFDRLKIAQPLLDEVFEHPKRRVILESIVTMGLRIGIEVVAEGIETEQQAELLRGLGCPLGQGFLFSRPMSAALAIDRYGAASPSATTKPALL